VLTNGDDIRMGKFRLMFLAWPYLPEDFSHVRRSGSGLKV
jgi:hypothetical protein